MVGLPQVLLVCDRHVACRFDGRLRRLRREAAGRQRLDGGSRCSLLGLLLGSALALAVGHAVEHGHDRSEEHTSELQSLMRNSSAVFCLKKKNTTNHKTNNSTNVSD